MIVFPMIGKSSRFFTAGYTIPKYELQVKSSSVFYHAVNSFRQYFDSDLFIFIVRNDFGAEEFVRKEIAKLGIKHFTIKVFTHDTRGQADTVYQGLRDMNLNESLYIFNIDTFRPNFSKPIFATECDGYLEVFEGEGEHWSFVQASSNGKVVRTTEKERISNLCSDGLYFFRHLDYFNGAFTDALINERTVRNEFYVAPLYNTLIKQGLDIRYDLIKQSELIFCGTPAEYEALL